MQYRRFLSATTVIVFIINIITNIDNIKLYCSIWQDLILAGEVISYFEEMLYTHFIVIKSTSLNCIQETQEV